MRTIHIAGFIYPYTLSQEKTYLTCPFPFQISMPNILPFLVWLWRRRLWNVIDGIGLSLSPLSTDADAICLFVSSQAAVILSSLSLLMLLMLKLLLNATMIIYSSFSLLGHSMLPPSHGREQNCGTNPWNSKRAVPLLRARIWTSWYGFLRISGDLNRK